MVRTIASGVDPAIDNFSFSVLESLMNELAANLTEEIQGKLQYDEQEYETLAKNLSEITRDVFNSYIDQRFQFRRASHAIPLVNTIDIMPKEELAVIAETLVNLTSFKR